MPNREAERTEVLHGTLDLMVLRTLVSLGPSHGYAIAARIEQVSDGALVLNMGTLYPGLMRLEHSGNDTAPAGNPSRGPEALRDRRGAQPPSRGGDRLSSC